MKIAFIGAGAANMICGSCLRDNAVAGAMKRLGHDVLLLPLYTPMRVDRDDASDSRVFYGGVSIYLQTKSAFFRRFKFLDPVLNSKPVLALASAMAGMTKAEDLGELTIATLAGDEGPQRREVERLADWLAEDFKPEIVNLPDAMFVGSARALRERLRVPVICSLTGEDLFIEGLKEPYRSRSIEILRRRASEVDGFIATSMYYADKMASVMNIPRTKIDVVRLGVNPAGFGRKGPRPTDPFTIGYMARIAPEKGFHVLVDAFRLLSKMPGAESARLRAAGWMGKREQRYFRENEAKIRKAGLSDRFEYWGEVSFERKVELLSSASVLSVPTVYADPKGLFVIEALMHGVPVVQPAHGAFPEIIEATGGGLLFKSGDPEDLAAKLHSLMADPARADELASKGQAAVMSDWTDERMAQATLAVYAKYL